MTEETRSLGPIGTTLDQVEVEASYHSQQLVDRFTTDLRDRTHVDQLAAGLSSVVQETLNPSALAMWLSDRR